jgi:hypothetical protein
MKKADWQYLVNTLLFLCIVGIIIIGILMGLFLPKGPSAPESSKYFLNLHRHQWGNIHFYLSIAFTVLLIIHLTLDWKWIKARATHIFKTAWKTALVATAAVSILLLFFIWLFYPKEPGAYKDYGIGRGRGGTNSGLQESRFYQQKSSSVLQDQDTITITGQMTLQDLENTTGISSQRIIEALGLPPKTSSTETLGRLRKKYGFSLIETRDILTKILNEEGDVLEESKIEEAVPDRQDKQEEAEETHAEEEKVTRGRLAENQSGILITGQKSFYEIQRQTGVPAQKIIEKLGLPQNVPLNENIGRLRRRYGFTLQDVRDTVASLIEKK